jgi:hypothetical protein
MATKPTTLESYTATSHTQDCERVLVTLLRGLGPWKDSVYLVGGLVPRYLVEGRPPAVPPHAGTSDVDVVIDVTILLETEAYHTLEENLKKMGFERGENDKHQKVAWRWQTHTDKGALIVIDLLTDAPQLAGGKVGPLPTDGNVSALNIPHSSIVFDMHEVREVRAELLGENGVAVEKVRHADLVSFTCLKAFAFDQRNERKDAHDLVYCIENWKAGLDAAKQMFRERLDGPHGDVLRKCLDILKARFAGDAQTEGFAKDGCVAVAKFELTEVDEPAIKEARALRQRVVADLVESFLKM